MKTVLFIFCAAFILNAQNIQNQVNNLTKTPLLRPAQWSVYARYVDDDRPILSHNAQKVVAPASGLKLFTTAMALDALGTKFRFKTELRVQGTIHNGVLDGNVLIIGGGDPTLGSSRVPGSTALDNLMQEWVVALQTAGIHSVTGKLIAVVGHFEEQTVPDNWLWSDLGNYYAAGAGGLNIHDNLYRLIFKPAKYTGGPAQIIRTEPFIPGLSFINRMKTGRRGSGDNGYIYCAPRQMHGVVRGTIPAGVKTFAIKGSIPDPALFCLQYFKQKLRESKIEFNGALQIKTGRKDIPETRRISTHWSPALPAIMTYINHRSFNLYAEAVGKEAARNMGFKASDRGIAKAMKHFLKKLGSGNATLDLYDGCGLSPDNRITAKMMTDMLSAMSHHPDFKFYYNTMSVAGVPDSIGFFSNWGVGTVMAGNARIKSGLINHVRSHSGYVHDRKGRLIAFSFIANGYKGKLRQIDAIHRKLILALARLQ